MRLDKRGKVKAIGKLLGAVEFSGFSGVRRGRVVVSGLWRENSTAVTLGRKRGVRSREHGDCFCSSLLTPHSSLSSGGDFT